MKRFDGLNYYEILKIPINSSHFEIKQAYRDMLSLYHEDSLPTYSLFSNEERDRILEEIETAFLTLIDEEKRSAYHKLLAESEPTEISSMPGKNRNIPATTFQDENMVNSDHLAERVRQNTRKKEIESVFNEILAKDVLSGTDLKTLREMLGVEVSEINAVTKISVSVINAIEENRFEDLPPDTYLKNFLRAYAKIVQVDPEKIVTGYFENISRTLNEPSPQPTK
jgi:DnaJ-class molecular chaperone